MKASSVEITLDPRPEQSREPLTGAYRLLPPARRLKSVELSMSWYTEGAGDEDTGVHHFEQREAEPAGPPLDAAKPVQFSIPYPEGPRSYEGFYIKIRWRVRVRMVDEDGNVWSGEAPVHIGEGEEEPAA